MKTIIRTLAAGALLSLLGCAPSAYVRPAATAPAHNLDVTVPNANKKDVIDALVSAMAARDFAVKAVTDYTAVFTRPVDQPAARGRKMGAASGPAEQRVSFTIAKAGAGVRLVLSNELVYNPGSANERATDASGGEGGASWQQFLNSFPNQFRGRIGITIDRAGWVTNVEPDSPAASAGIQKGDQMLRVDGAPYSGPDQLVGDPDTKVVVVVLRQGKEMPMIIYRKVISTGAEQQAPPPPEAMPAPTMRRK
ncbi:MAG TPA: PDZ domain-containing protein [Candidatus Edwardsbacteria bacterium]|nr:PDZ domain-containing protein [Candidatus Edwardsbacteria bacterium]